MDEKKPDPPILKLTDFVSFLPLAESTPTPPKGQAISSREMKEIIVATNMHDLLLAALDSANRILEGLGYGKEHPDYYPATRNIVGIILQEVHKPSRPLMRTVQEMKEESDPCPG